MLFVCVVTAADEDSDDMFKPPKMEDDDFSPFGGKSGLFSGGKGLFDDDDEVHEIKSLSLLTLLQSDMHHRNCCQTYCCI